jgi:hypothetical protein
LLDRVRIGASALTKKRRFGRRSGRCYYRARFYAAQLGRFDPGKGCSWKLWALLKSLKAMDPCKQLMDGFDTALPFEFSSCRNTKGSDAKCHCTDKERFSKDDWEIPINREIPLEQLLPSPLPDYIKEQLKKVGIDITDPADLDEIRKCSLIVEGKLRFSNARGWIGTCKKKDK